jgi:hypothetical protein
MTFFSSNELTGGHGVSPVARPKVPITNFTRAFLIYVRLAADPAAPENYGLKIRQFYHDYDKLHLSTPEQLMNAAAKLGPKSARDISGDLNVDLTRPFDISTVPGFGDRDVRELPHRRAQFPYVFAKGFDEVNFGWTPCHVIFLFDNPDFQFVPPDHEGSYNQPVVFRKNKAIQDIKGNWVAGGPYEENNSFFDLRVGTGTVPATATEPERSYSYLIMDNHMKAGTQQVPIEKPTTGDPHDWPVWRYCMDINVRIPQNRKSVLLGETEESLKASPSAATSWLTVVFDPPQNNGNGNGP